MLIVLKALKINSKYSEKPCIHAKYVRCIILPFSGLGSVAVCLLYFEYSSRHYSKRGKDGRQSTNMIMPVIGIALTSKEV